MCVHACMIQELTFRLECYKKSMESNEFIPKVVDHGEISVDESLTHGRLALISDLKLH